MVSITHIAPSAVAEDANGTAVSPPLTSLDKVGMRFGSWKVLHDVPLNILKEFICLIGPLGSDNTTLLRLLAGLQTPNGGTISYKGIPYAAANRHIALVFQDYTDALPPWRTAAGNVSLALEAAGFRVLAHIADLLGRVALGHYAEVCPREQYLVSGDVDLDAFVVESGQAVTSHLRRYT